MKILWGTSFNNDYYQKTVRYVDKTWNKLPGETFFLNDDVNGKDFLEPNEQKGDLTRQEYKFWKKSRAILYLLKQIDYDYVIWLDADVEVVNQPIVKNLIPGKHELFSANRKMPKNKTALDSGFLCFNMQHQHLTDFTKIYKTFWLTNEFENLSFRYDAPALEFITEKHKFLWKNLWYGKCTKGKSFCGFEDSILEQYFYHYWGKKKKNTATGWKKL